MLRRSTDRETHIYIYIYIYICTHVYIYIYIYDTILYYTILYYTTLHYTILYYTILYCTIRKHGFTRSRSASSVSDGSLFCFFPECRSNRRRSSWSVVPVAEGCLESEFCPGLQRATSQPQYTTTSYNDYPKCSQNCSPFLQC